MYVSFKTSTYRLQWHSSVSRGVHRHFQRILSYLGETEREGNRSETDDRARILYEIGIEMEGGVEMLRIVLIRWPTVDDEVSDTDDLNVSALFIFRNHHEARSLTPPN